MGFKTIIVVAFRPWNIDKICTVLYTLPTKDITKTGYQDGNRTELIILNRSTEFSKAVGISPCVL